MKLKSGLILLICACLLCLSAGKPDLNISPEEDLFGSDEPLKVSIKGDFKMLFKDRTDKREYLPFQISYEDKGITRTQKMKIMVRGNFRRSRCEFPPMKLNFSKKESKGTIFEGYNKVKMVVPCHMESPKFTNYLHLEYLTYKGYNAITDTSYKVRLVETTFIDEGGKYDTFSSWTFIIEPTSELGFRIKAQELEKMKLHPNNTHRLQATRLAMYEYMIGNTDWSIGGLHNIKLMEPVEGGIPVAVPYDFDFSGIISTPYATPDPTLGIRTVRDRLYRGFCQSEILTNKVIDQFKISKDSMINLYLDYPYLDEKQKKNSVNYLNSFFKTIENPKVAKRIFLKGCRTAG
ncbi:MAG: hypothetical protein MRZ79_20670 [Bacteroidia bacterium]|nr:hypothetical protein [Bacteroidia bacterium]